MPRGVVLLHTLIVVAVMALMASVVMRWAFARHVLAKKNMDSSIATGVVEGVYAKVFGCAQGTSFGVSDCDETRLAGCLPARAEISEGKCRDVTITTSGNPPSCRVEVTFDPNGPDATPCP